VTTSAMGRTKFFSPTNYEGLNTTTDYLLTNKRSRESVIIKIIWIAMVVVVTIYEYTVNQITRLRRWMRHYESYTTRTIH